MHSQGFTLGGHRGQPLTQSHGGVGGLSLGLQQLPGPQDGLLLTPRPPGRPGAGGLAARRSTRKTEQRRPDSWFQEVQAAQPERSVLAPPPLLRTGSDPPRGCGSASLVAMVTRSSPPPPGSPGEGGRDRGRLEKPGLQGLEQRSPRFGGNRSKGRTGRKRDREPAKAGPGQKKESGFTVSRLRETNEKCYYLHHV